MAPMDRSDDGASFMMPLSNPNASSKMTSRGHSRKISDMTEADPRERAAGLACWRDAVTPEPLSGGITNRNYLVQHRGERFVVRIGDDIPVHQITRANELAASRAAAAAGL